MSEILGGCRCGAVRYTLALDRLPPTYACHCRDCQTWSGSSFSQQTYLPEAALSVCGPLVVYELISPSGRISTQRMCGVCHTPNDADGNPDMSLYLAGSRSYDFEDIDGTIITVNAENLTSHNPEGLGSWTDDQIRTALIKGIDDEHIAIYPIMPYPEYSLLTPEDVDSIIQYLRTVPPNDNVVAADFPHFDQQPPAPQVKEADVPHTTLPKDDPEYEAAERGRYIAATACLNCHTEIHGSNHPSGIRFAR